MAITRETLKIYQELMTERDKLYEEAEECLKEFNEGKCKNWELYDQWKIAFGRAEAKDAEAKRLLQ